MSARRMVAVALVAFAASVHAAEKPAVSGGEKPLNVGLFVGGGAAGKGPSELNEILTKRGHQVTKLKDKDVSEGDISKFDLLIFPGGSGSGEGKAIGETGREKVRKFIEAGGGYVGICAGAYLGTCKYDWGLKVTNAQTVDSKHWKRGQGMVNIELTDAGKKVLGDKAGPIEIKYANGPLLGPAEMTELPGYEVLAVFRSELHENGAPEGVMINTPAIITAEYGKGRVMLLSPHAEHVPGLEWIIRNAANWVSKRPAEPAPTQTN